MADSISEALRSPRTACARSSSPGSTGSFCAGGALSTMSTPTTAQMRVLYRASLRLFDAIRLCPRPVIAAVNGAAAGGGNELVVACDLAIAARSATFGQTGPQVGSAPVTGATNVMWVQIGEKRAKELSFLCRRYTADAGAGARAGQRRRHDDELGAEVEALARRAAREEPALPGDRQGQLQHLVEPLARLLHQRARDAGPGRRQRRHGRRRHRLPGEAQAPVPAHRGRPNP